MFHFKVYPRSPFGLMIVLVSPPPLLFPCQLLVLSVPLLVVFPMLNLMLRSLVMH
jgi:hypothetical protein